MQLRTIRAINTITQQFYETVAVPFSRTRQKEWQGWEQLSPYIEQQLLQKEQVRLLDLGCGNGRFGVFLQEKGFAAKIDYVGFDSSTQLLAEAKQRLQKCDFHSLELTHFDIVDFLLSDKKNAQFTHNFDIIVAFGVLHHIPGLTQRTKLFEHLSNGVTSGGICIVAAWQLALDARFSRKLITSEVVGVASDELEENDYFVDWQTDISGIRYYHHVTEAEMENLAVDVKMQKLDQFYADGRSGRLNLYSVFSPADF